jgi:hypothetical protein
MSRPNLCDEISSLEGQKFATKNQAIILDNSRTPTRKSVLFALYSRDLFPGDDNEPGTASESSQWELSLDEKVELKAELAKNLVYLFDEEAGIYFDLIIKDVSLIALGMFDQEFHADFVTMPADGQRGGSMIIYVGLDKFEADLEFKVGEKVALTTGMVCIFSGDKIHRGGRHRNSPCIRLHCHYWPASCDADMSSKNQVQLTSGA